MAIFNSYVKLPEGIHCYDWYYVSILHTDTVLT
jgi:hypothetical protein